MNKAADSLRRERQGGSPKGAGGSVRGCRGQQTTTPLNCLERLAEGEPDLIGLLFRALVEGDGEVEAEQAEARSVAEPRAQGMAQREVEVLRALVDVAGVVEHRGPDTARVLIAQLLVEHEDGAPAQRLPGLRLRAQGV